MSVRTLDDTFPARRAIPSEYQGVHTLLRAGLVANHQPTVKNYWVVVIQQSEM